jgi:hypothetical protein
MRLLSKWVWVLLIVGCNEVSTATTATLAVTISDPGLGIRLEGVEVCDLETGRCVMTDAEGRAQLDFPVGAQISITATKEGYASYLVPKVLDTSIYRGLNLQLDMVSTAEVAKQHDRIGAPYPMRDTGTVVVVLLQNKIAGATFELVGATGTPFYHDEEGHWSPSLGATTSWGDGGFAEISHGEFQVNVGGAAWRCGVVHAWPGNDDDSVRFPVRVGFVTVASVLCAKRPTP